MSGLLLLTNLVGDDPELGLAAMLVDADMARDEMVALNEELSRLRSAHELFCVGAMRAALARILGYTRRLHARVASMDLRAPSPPGLIGLVHGLTEVAQILQIRVSAERRDASSARNVDVIVDAISRRLQAVVDEAVRRYVAVTDDAPTEEQVNLLIRAALLSAVRGEQAAAEVVAEVERGLLEVEQLFLDMAALVDAHDGRYVAAARRRRLCLAGGVAAQVLMAVALVVVAALILAHRGGQQPGNVLPLQLAADLSAR